MSWSKHSFSDGKILPIQFMAIFLILLSLYLDTKFLFFAGVISFVLISLNVFYEKKMGEGLDVGAERKRDRYFIDEQGNWELVFTNEGWPILNAEARVFFDQAVEPPGADENDKKWLHEVSFPLSLNKGEAKKFELPFTSKQRGLAKIRKIELKIPNLFGFGKVNLEYRFPLPKEVIVYPDRLEVVNKMDLVSLKPGGQFTPFSLYEDMLSPAGTRDYTYSDGFHRIHWKASARVGRLQTKLYDQVSEKGIVICINVADGYSIPVKFEEMLGSAADLAYFAYSRQIPVSLCMNMRNAGDVPFFYLPPGNGREQLQKIFEMLALANSFAPYPYEKMLSFMDRNLHMLPCLIHAGEMPGYTAAKLDEFRKRGIRLMVLQTIQDKAELTPFSPSMEGRRSS
ncbi:DUF58 domain-containing protein [Bacillus sp. FJAT-27245]|uniref:DUF58 domain-containing protein n=1 Tax=Bacillus sp. FJAT-27245 TaxID=1684144 RepID=UPI0006A7D5F4|nr:DUF58 domain-containing protein [Bacillus sp. FJAT-27245]